MRSPPTDTGPCRCTSRLAVANVMAKFLDLAGGHQPTQREALYFEHQGNRAVRRGKWMLVARCNQPWLLAAMRTDTLRRDCGYGNGFGPIGTHPGDAQAGFESARGAKMLTVDGSVGWRGIGKVEERLAIHPALAGACAAATGDHSPSRALLIR